MTLFDRIAPETLRNGRAPRLRTQRLVLRAPRLTDARTIATLVNDRRIAENTLRIPYPYGIADAQAFLAGANANSGETVFLITKHDATVLGLWSCRRARNAARDRLLARRSILGQYLAPGAGEVRLSVDGGRPLSHPIARFVSALRPFPARAQGVGRSPRRRT